MYKRLRITARSVFDELTIRGVEVEIIEPYSGLLRFRNDGTWRYVRSCVSDATSKEGKSIANKKTRASSSAQLLGLKLPEHIMFSSDTFASDFLALHGTVVVKPNDAAHGDGVTIGITSDSDLRTAIDNALANGLDKKVIVQQQVEGHDVRILMINGTLAAAAIRTPAEVIGDGTMNVRELINKENDTNDLRGVDYQKSLNIIDMIAAERYLGLSIDTGVLADGEVARVTGTANIGTGGKAIDVTEQIPTAVIEQAALLATTLGLECCGVDFIASDISDAKSYYFIEVNASPSFGLHMFPAHGKSRPVHKLFVQRLLTTA